MQLKWPNGLRRCHRRSRKGTHTSLQKAAKYWNIPLTSFSGHLNDKTKSMKARPQGILIEQKHATIITCILNMQIVGLSITL
jgi:hypothetical protein